ncbi:ferrochelatase hem15 [Cladophialophora chaetospira]|uniref:Ferrochelatase hem15 n=1 Tax=Cladophialophora chaetospira TaxID=386627 RepID=A0AA38X2D9_9EURO|nr:ferrochelatase hem15 [Cladophialophora chaetospira]
MPKLPTVTTPSSKTYDTSHITVEISAPVTTSKSTAMPSSASKSFLDLAPEIRNQIYYLLFDGQRVTIRDKATKDAPRTRPRNSQPKPDTWGPCTAGTNIIFASKQCLAEAKPILLSVADFDVDISAMFFERRGRSSSQSWPKTLQGFYGADLTLIRRLHIPNTARYHHNFQLDNLMRDDVVNQLLQMPWLYSLSIQTYPTYLWRTPIQRYVEGTGRQRLLRALDSIIRFKRLHKVAQHIQSVARASNRPAQLLFEGSIGPNDLDTIVCTEAFTQAVSVVDRTSGEILCPKRVEPELRLLRS